MRETDDIRRKVRSFAQIERIYFYIYIFFFLWWLAKTISIVPIIHVINPAVALSFFLHGFSFTPTVQQTSIIVIRLPTYPYTHFMSSVSAKLFLFQSLNCEIRSQKNKRSQPYTECKRKRKRKKEETILRLGSGSGADEILHLKARNIIRSHVFVRLVYFLHLLITYQMIIKTRQKSSLGKHALFEVFIRSINERCNNKTMTKLEKVEELRQYSLFCSLQVCWIPIDSMIEIKIS